MPEIGKIKYIKTMFKNDTEEIIEICLSYGINLEGIEVLRCFYVNKKDLINKIE